MIWAIVITNIALLAVSAASVGRRPQSLYVSLVIVVGALVELELLAVASMLQGTTPEAYVLGVIEDPFVAASSALLSVESQETFETFPETVAGVWPALCVVVSAAMVFLGVCVRYVIDRARHKLKWAPFSELDLSILWVYVLIAGVVLDLVSVIPGFPAPDALDFVARNVVVVSVIPLFVQGAATCKGVMNEAQLGLRWQIVLTVVAVLLGVIALIVVPIIGLLDFWLNFRKLDRDSGEEEG